MNERQRIAFDRRNQPPTARELSYVHKIGKARYVSRITVLKVGETWAWHARVGKVASNGHPEPLGRVGNAELQRMVQYGSEILHGVGIPDQIGVKAEGISFSFVKPFNGYERELAKDEDHKSLLSSVVKEVAERKPN